MENAQGDVDSPGLLAHEIPVAMLLSELRDAARRLRELQAHFLENLRDADDLERLLGHELAYQFRIFDLPVVGQQVRFAQDHLGSIVQFDWNVVEFQRYSGQKFLRDL